MSSLQKNSVVDDLQQHHRRLQSRGHLGAYRLPKPDFAGMASFTVSPTLCKARELFSKCTSWPSPDAPASYKAVAQSLRDRATDEADALMQLVRHPGWRRDDPTTWVKASVLYDRLAHFCAVADRMYNECGATV